MALDKAPTSPQRNFGFVDDKGNLTEYGFQVLQQTWRQVAAGYVIVPCTAAGQNDIVLTPALHKEGMATLTDHQSFSFEAVATSSGSVTVRLANDSTARKGYKANGATQAGSGDVVDGSLYLAMFLSSLDGGAGGFVLK